MRTNRTTLGVHMKSPLTLSPKLYKAKINSSLPSREGQRSEQQSSSDYWLYCIHQWYPHLHSKTYFIPPLYFHRVPYDYTTVGGQLVLVPRAAEGGAGKTTQSRIPNGVSNNPALTSVLDSDVRDDRAQERVLHCLRALAEAEGEVMMVVSQLKFGDYLNKPAYAAAAALLPRRIGLPAHNHRGDFDVLIIHSKYGLIAGEVKSVGANFAELRMTGDAQDHTIAMKVKDAVKNLNKAEVVLRHLVSDLGSVNCIKTLILPSVTTAQLERVLQSTPEIARDLCHCFSIDDVTECIQSCLCADHLSDSDHHWEVTEQVIQKLQIWWRHLVSRSHPLMYIIPNSYDHLVARFCGPATTITVHCVQPPRLEVRLEGEAVSETGERMSRLVLHPEQVQLLNASPPRVFLVGPPGTGKTLVLVLQGLNCLRQGEDVHVVSTCSESRAASIVIEQQLLKTVACCTSDAPGHDSGVCRLHCVTTEGMLETVIQTIANAKRRTCVLADEVINSNIFAKFCDGLAGRIPNVCIWAAAMQTDVIPTHLREVSLTTPLRSPPVIIREVNKAFQMRKKTILSYTESQAPPPTDGPLVKRIRHCEGQSGHLGNDTKKCVECGRQVARILADLRVGMKVPGITSGPPLLDFRDVFVLCNSTKAERTVDGFVTSQNIGLIQGLRACHVPVRVVERDDYDAIRDTALGLSNQVTVAHWDVVRGLERKVVVVAKDIRASESNRLHTVSRCTSQLVWIDC